MRHHSSLGNCLLVPQRSYGPVRIHYIPFTVCFYPRDAMLALCLCLSVCHKSVFYRNGWTDRAVFLARRLHSTIQTLCCKKIHVSTKITVFPSGTLSHTLKKFASAYRSSKRVIDLSRERWTLRA